MSKIKIPLAWLQNWLYSVMVSTSDSDSGNLGSIPGTTSLVGVSFLLGVCSLLVPGGSCPRLGI
jgi:hypothetical protein